MHWGHCFLIFIVANMQLLFNCMFILNVPYAGMIATGLTNRGREKVEEEKAKREKAPKNGNKIGYLNKRSPKWIVSGERQNLAQLVVLSWLPVNLYSRKLLFFSFTALLSEQILVGGKNACLIVRLSLFPHLLIWCLASFLRTGRLPRGLVCHACLRCGFHFQAGFN